MDADRHNITLRERIEALPEDSVLFRTDFPEYHSEFVGGTLAELTQEGMLENWRRGYMPSREEVALVLYYLLLIRSHKQLPHEITQKSSHPG